MDGGEEERRRGGESFQDKERVYDVIVTISMFIMFSTLITIVMIMTLIKKMA